MKKQIIWVTPPLRLFVFNAPKGFLPIKNEVYYTYRKNPYEVYDEETPNLDTDPFVEEIKPFHLRYFFKTEENLTADGKFAEQGYWKHTFAEMTELKVLQAFFNRLFEYYETDQVELFLDFHYNSYRGDLDEWLDKVTSFFEKMYFYTDEHPPKIAYLRVKKNADKWIAEKRKELAELKGETIEQPPTVEVVEETPKNTVERTKLQWNASNSALYHLFAKLSEKQTTKGEIPLNYTPELLAKFLIESFTDLPDIKTIQREIQKYRKTGGMAEKLPPKEAIDIRGIDFSAEI
ncbi:hypothetical protein [Runella sp.]|uniref:hypothetical protein n=1 Tax=Runella sp. TaxID=1960881 RepID=UPI00262E5EC9|nr:hypothetical protein [Runella sp.]